MEIIICMLPACGMIIAWLIKKEFEEKNLNKKHDNKTRIKREVLQPHTYEDHNTQYRTAGENTIQLWQIDKIETEAEERMRESIKTKVKR